MNAYAEMKKRHQEEVNALPMYWAFSDEQFDQQLKELGLTRNDTGKLCKTFGGGFCLASDAQMIADTLRGQRFPLTKPGMGSSRICFGTSFVITSTPTPARSREPWKPAALRWSRSKTTSGSNTGLRWRQRNYAKRLAFHFEETV